MKKFIEIVTPIAEAKGDKNYEDVLSTVQTMLDNAQTEEILAETGTIDLSAAFSTMMATDNKRCLLPFAISVDIIEDDPAHKVNLYLSEIEAIKLIEALQKKLAEIKMLNAYTKPLRKCKQKERMLLPHRTLSFFYSIFLKASFIVLSLIVA